jgi:DNA-binding NtrC family response regulator
MTMPLTIIVVEDEPLVMIDIVDQLKLAGYRVVEAFNADEAIAILEADPDIRLLFTDVDMPGSMNGLKLAAAVRDRWPPVRIIVTSGHRTVEALDMPQESLFFGKQYRPSDVIVSVQRLLDSTPLQTGRGTH